MLKKYAVGKTENGKYFVRRVDTKILSENLVYPIKPMAKKDCIAKLQELAKKHPSILIMHDGLCGTTNTHQDCMKIIIEAINQNENTAEYGESELIEFHDSNNNFQFITSRKELSKAMIVNNEERNVDALLDDYYKDFDEAHYIYEILSNSDICMYRELTN